jgi:transcriptional regulator
MPDVDALLLGAEYYELAVTDIAEMLGCTRQTVGNARRRGRMRVDYVRALRRKLLEAYGDEVLRVGQRILQRIDEDDLSRPYVRTDIVNQLREEWA